MPIAKHSYNEAARTYSVQFREGGPTYVYQEVDKEAASAVRSADDADLGKVIQSTLVRGGFEFVKVDPDAKDEGI